MSSGSGRAVSPRRSLCSALNPPPVFDRRDSSSGTSPSLSVADSSQSSPRTSIDHAAPLTPAGSSPSSFTLLFQAERQTDLGDLGQRPADGGADGGDMDTLKDVVCALPADPAVRQAPGALPQPQSVPSEQRQRPKTAPSATSTDMVLSPIAAASPVSAASNAAFQPLNQRSSSSEEVSKASLVDLGNHDWMRRTVSDEACAMYTERMGMTSFSSSRRGSRVISFAPGTTYESKAAPSPNVPPAMRKRTGNRRVASQRPQTAPTPSIVDDAVAASAPAPFGSGDAEPSRRRRSLPVDDLPSPLGPSRSASPSAARPAHQRSASVPASYASVSVFPGREHIYPRESVSRKSFEGQEEAAAGAAAAILSSEPPRLVNPFKSAASGLHMPQSARKLLVDSSALLDDVEDRPSTRAGKALRMLSNVLTLKSFRSASPSASTPAQRKRMGPRMAKRGQARGDDLSETATTSETVTRETAARHAMGNDMVAPRPSRGDSTTRRGGGEKRDEDKGKDRDMSCEVRPRPCPVQPPRRRRPRSPKPPPPPPPLPVALERTLSRPSSRPSTPKLFALNRRSSRPTTAPSASSRSLSERDLERLRGLVEAKRRQALYDDEEEGEEEEEEDGDDRPYRRPLRSRSARRRSGGGWGDGGGGGGATTTMWATSGIGLKGFGGRRPSSRG